MGLLYLVYVLTRCGHLEEGYCFSVRMKENIALTTVHAELYLP